MPTDSLRDQLQASLVGRYQIERELARGGMATVYLARDIKHDRHVALKVLDPELGAVLGVERFLAEIRVTANLQHPNLLPLFESGNADGHLYYVMPYVDGESLRSKLARENQLPVDEAIHIATAVASALDYAHRHGVIHRDLKPDNVLLHEGEPLVADFGIALAVSKAGGGRVTQTGISLGTPQYMSPEQASGDRLIDGRTDVYSLGAVTYEMLTGDPPHTGSTAQAIIARLLTDRPRSVRSSRSTVPEHVDAAVLRALEKLPADRWHTAREFADAINGRGAAAVIPTGVPIPGALPRSPGPRRRGVDRRTLTTAGAFVAALAVAVATTRWIGARTAAAPSVSFVIDPPIYDGVRQSILDFAISPDGGTVVFLASSVNGWRAYVRRLSEPNAYPIPGTEGASFGAFSPDGKRLSLSTNDGKLLNVPVDGATAPITLANGIDFYSGSAWADNETIVLGSSRPSRIGLGRIAASGGAVQTLTTPKSAGLAHAFPHVAPDGKTVIFVEWGPGFTEDDFLAIGSLETGSFHTSALMASRPVGVVDGRVIYRAGSSIMAVSFDAKRLRVTGDPVVVLDGITTDGQRSAALSASGTLAYKRGQPTTRLVLLDRDGRMQALSSDEHNIWSDGFGGRFSPDGQRIAVDVWGPSGDTTTADIWTFDVRRRTFTRVTSLGNVVEPAWTPDGTRLVFTTWFPRKAALWMQAADGSQPAERLLEAPDGIGFFHSNVTPDGRGVVFCRGPRYAAAFQSAGLFYMPFDGDRKPERLTDEPMTTACLGSVSPDGRWLAYVATEGGRPRVFVRRFRAAGGRVKISEGNGLQPTWSRDGKRLFYSSGTLEDGKNWAVVAEVRAVGNTLEVVSQERMVALPQTALFDVTPDGDRILTVQQSDSRVQLLVTTNWLPQLRARLARGR